MIWNQTQSVIFSSQSAAERPSDLVTVCISAYNYEKYVVSALTSVAAQTHAELELIVVDDASGEDGTRDVAKSWMERNKSRFWRSLLLVNRRNQGPSLTRNAAFERACGDFVFVLDADNEIYPRAIAELYRIVREGPYAAAYSQLEMFGLRCQLGHADIFDRRVLQTGNYIDVMALIAKSAWQRVGGFSHLELGWEDYDFWLKFAEAGFSAAFLPEILCRYRVHGASRTDTDALPSHEMLRQVMAIRHPVQLL